MKPVPAAVGRAALGVAVAALWCAQLWLLFGAATGTAFVLGRRSWLDSYRWRPARAAATAIAAARGWPAAVADEVGAVVVESYGPRRAVARAGQLLEERADLGRWAASAEALVIADEASRALPRPRLRISPLPRLIVSAVASAAAVIWQWSPVLYVVAFTGAVASLTDLREEREVRPPLMALRALHATRTQQPPADPHLRIALRAGSRSVIARARRLLQKAALSEQERSGADAILHRAHHVLGPSNGHPLAVAGTWLPAVVGGLVILAACG